MEELRAIDAAAPLAADLRRVWSAVELEDTDKDELELAELLDGPAAAIEDARDAALFAYQTALVLARALDKRLLAAPPSVDVDDDLTTRLVELVFDR